MVTIRVQESLIIDKVVPSGSGDFEIDSFEILPFSDSYKFKIDSYNYFAFAGENLSQSEKLNISEIDFLGGSDGSRFQASIEGVNISKDQVDASINSLNKKGISDLIKSQFFGDDIAYINNGHSEFGTFDGNDKIYVSGGTCSINSGAGDDTFYFTGSHNDQVNGCFFSGGSGNDLYILGDISVNVLELLGEGTDRVDITDARANLKYILPNNVENCTMVNHVNGVISGNSLNNKITGNEEVNSLYGGKGDDVLTGNAGNDVLNGGLGIDTLWGGEGNDKLTGGAGADTFKFRSGNFGGVDTITDFSHSDGDKIACYQKDFRLIGAKGVISVEKFWAGSDMSTAIDKNSSHIIYNTDTGDLYFAYKNSKTASDGILFAHLDGHPDLSYVDFIII